MTKQSRDTIVNGLNGWDATVNNNFIKLFERPLPLFLHTGDESNLASSFPPATNEEGLIFVDHTVLGLTAYEVDKNHPAGSEQWVQRAGRGSKVSAATPTNTVLLGHDDIMVLGTPTAIATYTMRPAAEMAGLTVTIKNLSTFAITVDGSGAETIDGVATHSLPSQYDFARYYSDGTAWHIVG